MMMTSIILIILEDFCGVFSTSNQNNKNNTEQAKFLRRSQVSYFGLSTALSLFARILAEGYRPKSSLKSTVDFIIHDLKFVEKIFPVMIQRFMNYENDDLFFHHQQYKCNSSSRTRNNRLCHIATITDFVQKLMMHGMFLDPELRCWETPIITITNSIPDQQNLLVFCLSNLMTLPSLSRMVTPSFVVDSPSQELSNFFYNFMICPSSIQEFKTHPGAIRRFPTANARAKDLGAARRENSQNEMISETDDFWRLARRSKFLY